MLNQFGEGGSALASGVAAGGADVSGASSSKQHIGLGRSQRGLVPAGAGKLQQHLDLEHPASGPRSCSDCISSSEGGLKQHNNAIHSIGKSLQLYHCEQSHATRKPLQEHIKCKQLCGSKHQCQFCSNSYTTEADLKKHILLQHPRRHAQKYSRSKYADGCKEFKQKHRHSKSSSLNKFCCTKCDDAFATKQRLKRH
ncbi:zinc finger Y-chromosomal protein-like, partial [Hyalella azteca]|uniref:Zinc finger Y-chromosomal protein-like n=1 Tax=Hyalella azteca TaxID=294128 RepID=A0A979FM74_HYAAZ